ncbi:hypothetical protein RSOLAG22IIIB_12956 [Rhizoctonia solani]|uniref:Transposase family Tnp2 protein n=1 Tax=Rhizoctonia solani TaxID=456999 RepID=A0A0K6GHR4_9AGAM|nr:hypothetical protein RSOLAG22IIIB_12956 [Rhizoctonia solani]
MDETLDKTSPCPHCGKPLCPRQINRHLAGMATSAAANHNHPDSDSDLHSNPDFEIDPVGSPLPESVTSNGAGHPMDLEGDLDDDEPMDAMDIFHQLQLPPLESVPIHHNPPVTIEDWPDPEGLFIDLINGEDGEDDEASIDGGEFDDGPDRDPPFVERGGEDLGAHAEDEPLMDDEMLRAFLEMHLGDYAEEEWFDLYNRVLSERDHRTLRLLATRLRTHFSRQTWEDLRHAFAEELDLPSSFVAWRRLRILSGLETHSYDCCVNSCVCFLGRYSALDACPVCNERRLNTHGSPRRSFRYTPLIPQLRGLFRNPEMLEKLRYRLTSEQRHRPGVIEDIFDSENYRRLRATPLDPDEPEGYHFFDASTDIALGLSTDGFTLFKRRKRGLSTAWPILLINYNLHPSSRVRLENLICVGVIPGPKQCKDLNSFLVPLLDELLELENGVLSVQVPPNANAANFNPDAPGVHFVLRAFLITLFGDIPAVSKLLSMKGHNAKTPCRMCYIQGTLCRLARSSVYYVPLTPPDAEQEVLPEDLPLRTHESFLAHYAEIEQAPNNVLQKQLAQRFGLNSRPVFSRLRSLDLSTCAPYDAMHLLFENLVPNMINHWFGTFKGLDEGSGNYTISLEGCKKIGRLTVKAVRTTPSAFVGTLHDIFEDRHLYKAEGYSYWFQYLGAVLLEEWLPQQYYEHYLLMRNIIDMVLQFEITDDELDELEQMVNQWVSEYEQYYYQYEAIRLPTCTLTIHALLHMPRTIRKAGPLWTSWAFVMERFCGFLLPAVKNRTRPYEHLDNFVQRRAQMQIVSWKYNLPSLSKPNIHYTHVHGEMITSREKIYEEFPTVVLGTPVHHHVRVTPQLTNQLTKYFGTVYHEMGLDGAGLRARIDYDTLVRYGRCRLAGDGDRIRTSGLIDNDPDQGARDNSYVRYDLLPDANARYRNRPEAQFRQTHYGRLLDIYYVEFVVDLENPDETREPYLLARVQECITGGLDATLRENPLVTYTRMKTPDIIHMESINAVVGRVDIGNRTWAIIDRSRHGARTQFVDENGEMFD